MANTIFKISYKVQVGTVPMKGILRITHNGFPEMLDIEKQVKDNLKKWKKTVKLIDIENIEEIVE